MKKITGLGTLPAIAITIMSAICHESRAAGPSPSLTPEHLADVGLHLPSYLPTIRRFMDYQDQTSTHQHLTVEWDALPGRNGTLKAEDVAGIPLSPNFALLRRARHIPGGAGKSERGSVGSGMLIVAAVDSAKQVRGLQILPDPREFWGEDLRPGHSHKSWSYVRPKGSYDIFLPDDPQIQTVMFFKPAQGKKDGGWSLQLVGTLVLPSK